MVLRVHPPILLFGIWILKQQITCQAAENFFCKWDESTSSFVKFGDNSRIRIKGKGVIEINKKNGEILRLSNVLFVPQLAANILSLGCLDEEGKLTIFYCDGCLFKEMQRSEGRIYLLKLSIVDQCLITTQDTSEDWLWHFCFGHISFHMLKEMSSKAIVEIQSMCQVNSAEIALPKSITGHHFLKHPPFVQLSL